MSNAQDLTFRKVCEAAVNLFKSNKDHNPQYYDWISGINELSQICIEISKENTWFEHKDQIDIFWKNANWISSVKPSGVPQPVIERLKDENNPDAIKIYEIFHQIVAAGVDKFQPEKYQELSKPYYNLYADLKCNRCHAALHRAVLTIQPNIFTSLVSDKNTNFVVNTLRDLRVADGLLNCGSDLPGWCNANYKLREKINNAFPEFKSNLKELYPCGWALCEYFNSDKEFKALKGGGEMSIVERVKKILLSQHNIILHGAPGTGKTYLADRAAHELAESDNIKIVQFHPAYDYSDFVEGLRPGSITDGRLSFEYKPGSFKKFCQRAACDPENTYVFIIDEINRGDLPRIFGEVFSVIEPGYRSKKEDLDKFKVDTQYQNMITDDKDEFYQGFYVPDNVYLIGTMNDIDRSVEHLDFAIRRRFVFVEVTAADSLAMLQNTIAGAEDRAQAIAALNAVNKLIEDYPELGPDYQIGAAFFNGLGSNGLTKEDVWLYKIEPLLREYLRVLPAAAVQERIAALKSAFDNKSADA